MSSYQEKDKYIYKMRLWVSFNIVSNASWKIFLWVVKAWFCIRIKQKNIFTSWRFLIHKHSAISKTFEIYIDQVWLAHDCCYCKYGICTISLGITDKEISVIFKISQFECVYSEKNIYLDYIIYNPSWKPELYMKLSYWTTALIDIISVREQSLHKIIIKGLHDLKIVEGKDFQNTLKKGKKKKWNKMPQSKNFFVMWKEMNFTIHEVSGQDLLLLPQNKQKTPNNTKNKPSTDQMDKRKERTENQENFNFSNQFAVPQPTWPLWQGILKHMILACSCHSLFTVLCF